MQRLLRIWLLHASTSHSVWFPAWLWHLGRRPGKRPQWGSAFLLVVLNLSAAFDSISILMECLLDLRLGSTMLQWVHSFGSNRPTPQVHRSRFGPGKENLWAPSHSSTEGESWRRWRGCNMAEWGRRHRRGSQDRSPGLQRQPWEKRWQQQKHRHSNANAHHIPQGGTTISGICSSSSAAGPRSSSKWATWKLLLGAGGG